MSISNASANDDDLADGWVKMQDQYGDYYINLYNKQTSRIKPVRASVFQKGALPPPPPAPQEDDNEQQEQQQQQQQQQQQPQVPQSPQQAPLSPHSQQQAMQQQMWNQQLYQQQWQAYYAQQQYMQQQQWAAQQQQQQQLAMQQQQMAMQQNPQQMAVQQNPQQMAMQQNPQQIQQPMQYNPQQQQQWQQHQYQQQNNNNDDDESTASTVTDENLEESSSVTDQDDENEDEKSQVQPQPQQQQVPQENNGVKPKEVPPISNNNVIVDSTDNNVNPKYAFQPIMPPSMNISASNDSFRGGSISIQKVDISPVISQNNSSVHSSVNPSPAFNPNKLSSVAAIANADFTGSLPPAMEQSEQQIDEGTDIINQQIPPVYANNYGNNDDVAPPAPVIDKQGSSIFGVMLNQADKIKHLQEEANWVMLLDGVEQNCPVTDRYDVLKAMRKVAKNLLIDDEKYQTLYADNDMVQKKILGRVGGYEFLRGIGFKQGIDDNELVCNSPDQVVLKLAIDSLQKRINALKQSRNQWDPKRRFKKKPIEKNPVNVPPKNDVNEEERQLQEALRLSEQQHIHDMLVRQQRELDFAKQKKSVNIYAKNDEDDQKKSWE